MRHDVPRKAQSAFGSLEDKLLTVPDSQDLGVGLGVGGITTLFGEVELFNEASQILVCRGDGCRPRVD